MNFKRMNLLEIQELALALSESEKSKLSFQLLAEIKDFRRQVIAHENAVSRFSQAKMDRQAVYRIVTVALPIAIAIESTSSHAYAKPILDALNAIAEVHNPMMIFVDSGEDS